MLSKLCKRCGCEKPANAEFFGPRVNGRYGLMALCKPCHLEHRSAWKAKNRQNRIAARGRERRHSVSELSERLSYDPTSGLLFWKERPGTSGEIKRWNSRYAGKPVGTTNANGYVALTVDGFHYIAHHVAWALTCGAWPDRYIDHRNGERSNNRFEELRDATRAENSRNRSPTSKNSSGRLGVYLKDDGNYVALIRVSGRLLHLGYTTSFQKAVSLRECAEKFYFGEFAPCAREGGDAS